MTTVRLASPVQFPYDPRSQQLQQPIRENVWGAYRVFGSHQRDRSRLLGLPDEILWRITAMLAQQYGGKEGDISSSLSSFALAHRECTQLARPHQFALVTITHDSAEFFRHLKWEAARHQAPHEPPSIRAYVRCLEIDLTEFPNAYDRELEPGFEAAFDEWTEMTQLHMDELAEIIEPGLLPGLERVHWRQTPSYNESSALLSAVLACSDRLRELIMSDYHLYTVDLDIITNLMPAAAPLPITSLVLGESAHDIHSSGPEGLVSYMADGVFRSCAPTLESLLWDQGLYGDHEDALLTPVALASTGDGGVGPIRFPRLQKFWTRVQDQKTQPSVLACFLASPLLQSFAPSPYFSSLILDPANDLDRFLPLLTRLRTFAVPDSPYPTGTPPTADEAGRVWDVAGRISDRIEELFVYPIEAGGEPLLRAVNSDHGFPNLRFLCFVWPVHGDVGLRVLRAVGRSLPALEEVSFGLAPAYRGTGHSRGDLFGLAPPSHQGIIEALSPLRNLVRLAVFGNEYAADWAGDSWSWSRYFKEFVRLNQDCVRESHWDRTKANSERHWATGWVTGNPDADDARPAAVEIARKYARAFPKLEWFICGMILLEVVR